MGQEGTSMELRAEQSVRALSKACAPFDHRTTLRLGESMMVIQTRLRKLRQRVISVSCKFTEVQQLM